jgi:hypothetical protein
VELFSKVSNELAFKTRNSFHIIGSIKADISGLTGTSTISAATGRGCFAVRCSDLVEGASCVIPTWQRIRIQTVVLHSNQSFSVQAATPCRMVKLLMLMLQGCLSTKELETGREGGY